MLSHRDDSENVSSENTSKGNHLENEIGENAKKSSRWRKRKSSEYKRNQRKVKRNKSEEYYSESTNKVMGAREIGLPCLCSRQCATKIIFTQLWNLGSFDIQNSYLFGCIKMCSKKRHYPKKPKKAVSGRKYSVEYYVTVNTETIKICKSEFMSVHGL
uniref:Uncharacterized protein LOC114325131 isoform X2 n=1 Tax=Diabrotica virgifera virgifera TaxID=50390 RepID=A0A6P7F544_DIAVI